MQKTTPNQVTLTFPNLYVLWSFARTLRAQSIEINTVDNQLICPCAEVDITRALIQYQAKLEEGTPSYGTRHTQNI